MNGLYFYDDLRARQFEPFALTRPCSEMRAGTSLVRRRWEAATGMKSKGFISAPHLAHFEEGAAPPAVGEKAEIPAGSVVINSRCIIALDTTLETFDLLMCDGLAAAVRLARPVPVSKFADGSLDLGTIQTSLGGRKVAGRWMAEVWDYIATLGDQLTEDIPRRAKSLVMGAPDLTVYGKGAVFVEEGAEIGPNVVFDVSAGPILVRRGAVISPFTHLVGPLYVGNDAQVLGDRVASSSIGDVCKVRGELSNSIFIGHANKGHAGFVGHSYLGRWVNLGALTTTSNLKNTYGSVQLWTRSGLRNTGQQFLGTLFGDHAKTGIGTMLSTGTVLGAGANVFGAKMPPKVVPPFAWGDCEPYDTFDLTRFLEVAERAMARRHVKLGKKARQQLADAHRGRWSV
jgi:UDP-N-acetylglucosamine diphosphorylase / glucose-1-phosphate thymidylyltransferase / UDP-N-acetylgalactosamine diphosphorylase / glucosamine-1-phosphate N-acetyltransferase / galactosamine-1-phosphate N-acetyltransferase